MRTYGEAVDVRPAARDRALEDVVEPGQFLWRGRLYVVRAVLAHWVELGPWWTGSTAVGIGSARSDRSDRPSRSSRGRAPRTLPAPPSDVPRSDVPRSVARDVGAVEREVWRVEARAGRSSSTGVYDLVRDVPPPGSGRRPRWRLARALD